jgi:hypothetical protein
VSQGICGRLLAAEVRVASLAVSEGSVMDREALGQPFSKSFRLILSYHPIAFPYVLTHSARKAFPQSNLKMSAYGATQSRHVETL